MQPPLVRKQRCGECAGCRAAECGECRFCLNMKKFGGPGTLKQPCLKVRTSMSEYENIFFTTHVSLKILHGRSHVSSRGNAFRKRPSSSRLGQKVPRGRLPPL
mmetsp:Transcript_44406/g.100413  ORF Transcript_44406/g.100413 Transcript_44406/m.100413 type:complete len:103 (+) Transcript_44406:42-350(+)